MKLDDRVYDFINPANDAESELIQNAVGARLCKQQNEEQGSIEADEERLRKEEEEKRKFTEQSVKLTLQKRQDVQNTQAKLEQAKGIASENKRFNKDAELQTRRTVYEEKRDKMDPSDYEQQMQHARWLNETRKQHKAEMELQRQQQQQQQQQRPKPPRSAFVGEV